MRDISFGQYYPVSSFIHSIDARIKILVTLLFMVTVFLLCRIRLLFLCFSCLRW